MTPRFASLPVLAVLVLLLQSGCAGWRGDTYYAHRSPPKRARKETTYRFSDPGPGWAPVRNLNDIQVAWMNRGYGAVIEIHAQCDGQGDSSLDQYTDHLRIDWTGWDVESQEQTRLVGRAALHTVVRAELDGVPRHNDVWVVKKNGCLFDLHYSGDPEYFEAGQADFARVVEGFRYPVEVGR